MQGLGDGGAGVQLAGVAAAEEVGEEDGDQQQDQAHDGHPCTQHSHSTILTYCLLKLLKMFWKIQDIC